VIDQDGRPIAGAKVTIHTPDGSMDEIGKLYKLKKVSLVSAIDDGPKDKVGEGTTARMYGVGGFPTSVVIDRKGKVAFRSNDPANQAAMAAIVQKLGIDMTRQPIMVGGPPSRGQARPGSGRTGLGPV
jgi:hypothetical protein